MGQGLQRRRAPGSLSAQPGQCRRTRGGRGRLRWDRGRSQRPLRIPTVKDRVVQTAVVLVLGPIFEADLAPQQYGFRPGRDAKTAVRRAYFHIIQHDRREVVDADLSDYFTTIPHGPLLRCVTRRVTDGQILSTLKRWLTVPVWERTSRGAILCTTEARDRKRGTPQGGRHRRFSGTSISGDSCGMVRTWPLSATRCARRQLR